MNEIDGTVYVTTSEACAQLGTDITPAMIRDWVRRGLLSPAGRHPGRSHVFRWGDVQEAEYRVRSSGYGRKRARPARTCLPKIAAAVIISADMGAVNATQKRPGTLGSVVYYLQSGGRVQIGHWRNLPDGLAALPQDDLLAVEPGALELERLRQRQFDHCRVARRRGWFHNHPDLGSHVNMLVRHFGSPSEFLSQQHLRP